MSKVIVVGMADLNIARDPDVLTTLGLGSCVGITLYDPIARIGGMAHFMLPTSRNVSAGPVNRAKFADTAISDLLNKMIQLGARRPNLIAKMAGGAHMFSSTVNQDILKVGERNSEACRVMLKKLAIPIKADDTGGTHGRTIELNTANGVLTIKTIGRGIQTF